MWVAVVQSSSTARCMIAGCMPSQGIFFSLFVGFADSIIARRCHHTSLLGILDGVLEKQVIIARKTTAPPPHLAMGSKASACLFACRTRTGELLSCSEPLIRFVSYAAARRQSPTSERTGRSPQASPSPRAGLTTCTAHVVLWIGFCTSRVLLLTVVTCRSNLDWPPRSIRPPQLSSPSFLASLLSVYCVCGSEMELGLRMGEAPARRPLRTVKAAARLKDLSGLDLMLGIGRSEEGEDEKGREEEVETEEKGLNLEALLPAPPKRSSPPLLRCRSATETSKNLSFIRIHVLLGNSEAYMRGLDVNRAPSAEERASSSSSPNSTVSCSQMDFSAQRGGVEKGGGGGVGAAAVGRRASLRVSDEEENGLVRKKLRLSKVQSNSLEESFEEHSTLNPVSDPTPVNINPVAQTRRITPLNL
ncbi:hypothetical protein BHM03_00061382 [Ensete ventricosum]|nr:hypothetical protein BHM03_00061382 [Ensete ventricosum]